MKKPCSKSRSFLEWSTRDKDLDIKCRTVLGLFYDNQLIKSPTRRQKRILENSSFGSLLDKIVLLEMTPSLYLLMHSSRCSTTPLIILELKTRQMPVYLWVIAPLGDCAIQRILWCLYFTTVVECWGVVDAGGFLVLPEIDFSWMKQRWLA